MANPSVLAKLAAVVLTDEEARKKMGWVIALSLSPLILVLVLLCSVASGSSNGNVSSVELCFNGGTIPDGASEEYRTRIGEMQNFFSVLDDYAEKVNSQDDVEKRLDNTKIKALFYALYFGGEDLAGLDPNKFAGCFVHYETRTRIVDGVEESYAVAVPIEDMDEICRKIETEMGVPVSEEVRKNANSVSSLIAHGSASGSDAGGAFIGADGFCSPVGENWRDIITSEFGYRKDPFTGKTKGHSGMDLAVPTGTSIRAALPGTVITLAYNKGGYGYYVMIDHGDGLVTLYGHCSQLLAQVGQTVEAGDVIALSGSIGRSTGPNMHFEVRVDGERTNSRPYLP